MKKNEFIGLIYMSIGIVQPVILCCASGNRSGQAADFLKNNGVDCENGGS